MIPVFSVHCYVLTFFCKRRTVLVVSKGYSKNTITAYRLQSMHKFLVRRVRLFTVYELVRSC